MNLGTAPMLRGLTLFLFCVSVGSLALVPVPVRAQGEIAEAVRAAAEDELSSRFPKSASSTRVRVRRVRGAADTTARLRVRFADERRAPRGIARAEVQAKTGGGTWAEAGWALLYVAHYDSVMTTERRVRAGETLAPAAVQPAWIETTDIRGTPLLVSEYRARGSNRLVAARLLQAGRPLREADVRRPYVTKTGSAIDVHYRRGRFSLRLSCEAREPGMKNEVIRVYCPDIRTSYRAQIVAENAARWIETL